MDAQKEIKKECSIVKKHALNMCVVFFDKLIYMSKIEALEANRCDRQRILSKIGLDLPWHIDNIDYTFLMCTFILERLLDRDRIYESIEIFKHDVSVIIDEIESILLIKNLEYDNSALDPVRIFSKANNVEQINVRLDDKLSRIMNDCEKTIKEDTVFDFIGYLILKIIAEKQK